ncbi:MAG TPA: BtpA/SgcQ family protein [Acidimicrobiia bacterium]|nr:BtpA/SgcQ family protein [Acidimicrobiia bacterium]
MIPRIVGMVHLGPLPGAPGFDGDLDAVVDAAVADTTVLRAAGFDAVMVENFGDAPFYADDVPDATVAAMTRCVLAVRDAAGPLPVGVNVLRNDALAALAIAAATGASMIRVNVLSGTMWTDQGPITGKAAELARLRAALRSDVAVLADVFVKHAVPAPGMTISDAARDTWERSGADALVVSGPGTGHALDLADARAVKEAVPGAPLVAGSGTSPGNVAEVLDVCDAVIVGTAVKEGGVPGGRVHPERAKLLVQAAGR